jgi:dTDP-glucose 4,6-dehydratase
MQNVLVTGGCGFIGANFVRHMLQAEPEVNIINLDKLTYAGSLENIKDLSAPDRHTFIQGDICDTALVNRIFSESSIDTVAHFAAETHVDRSILGPAEFIQTNIVGTFTLLEAARTHWLDYRGASPEKKRFHHVSTDEVYGTLLPDAPDWTEDTPYDPSSPYSAAKASSDHLVRAYHRTYGLPVSITNCSNNYGPYQFPEKLIPLFILNAVQGRPLPVYGDGQQIRDWLYVEDHCEAILRVMTDGIVGQTYNIGGNNQPPNLVVIEQICAILDEMLPQSPFAPHKDLIKYVADRPGHDRRYAIDITKITTDLGWHPRQSLESGLQKTIDWYLGNPDWVSSIQSDTEFEIWIQKNYSNRGEGK